MTKLMVVDDGEQPCGSDIRRLWKLAISSLASVQNLVMILDSLHAAKWRLDSLLLSFFLSRRIHRLVPSCCRRRHSIMERDGLGVCGSCLAATIKKRKVAR